MRASINGGLRVRIGLACCDGSVGNDALHEAEMAFVESAGEKRRQDFASGRRCARLALQNIGLPAVAILSDVNGAPRWPDGVIGSISHTRGLTVASVAENKRVKGVGIDAEHLRGAFPADVFGMIATEAEILRMRRCLATDAERARYVVFSAKESVFKCFYSAFQESVALDNIEIHLDAGMTSFHAAIPHHGEQILIGGRVGVCADYVITVAWCWEASAV